MKNRKKYVKKTLRKASCIFNANFNDFCLHFGSQNPSKKLSALAFFRHLSQDTSKMPPRRPKTPPRHLQDASKTFQEASKTPLRTLKTPPSHLQDASKTLQEASKTPLRPPKTSPRHLWTAQRCLQAASSCSETPEECYKIEGFEKSVNFHFFSFDVSSFFMFSGFPWRGKGQTPLSKQFIC